MPCPFTGPKMFCARQNILSQPKSLTAFSAFSKTFEKKKNYWMQIIFLSGRKCFWLPQHVNKFLVWHKKFGPAQNILGPVKWQGIKVSFFHQCSMMQIITVKNLTFKFFLSNFFGFSDWNVDLKVRWYLEFT